MHEGLSYEKGDISCADYLAHVTLILYQVRRDISGGTADQPHRGFCPLYKILISPLESQPRGTSESLCPCCEVALTRPQRACALGKPVPAERRLCEQRRPLRPSSSLSSEGDGCRSKCEGIGLLSILSGFTISDPGQIGHKRPLKP